MGFKNFRFLVILRMLVITISISIFAYCIVHGLYLRSVYIGLAICILLVELIWYVDRFHRDFKNFLLSLLQRDFTTHFNEKGKGRTFNELYEALNKITELFKTISSEKEIQYRYLEMLVDHVRVGILSYDQNEKIQLVNNALKKLLHKTNLSHLKNLEAVDVKLAQIVRQINSGETKLINLEIDQNFMQLSIHASEFRLEGNYFKLVSMQNIKNELDAKEMEAWQKLIRVLTHEIMNSVSPITSLSETLHEIVATQQNHTEWSKQSVSNLAQGLEAIKIRSEGLQHFTEAYRRLTHIPQPVFKKMNCKSLLSRIATLHQYEADEWGVSLLVEATDHEVLADPELMEQVLINLVKNAMDAVRHINNARITLRAFQEAGGKSKIIISDNGAGIEKEMREKIFVPFFTTKKNGSGIGLALSKQILQLHNAQLQVTSELGAGTDFIITL